MHSGIHRLQQALRIRHGQLTLAATVGPDGTVTEVRAPHSPDEEMTRHAATLLMLTKFKPALCAGVPCRMDFPLRYTFSFR